MSSPAAMEAAGELSTSRLLPAPCAAVYGALTTPRLLQQWWGPAGFTNTFLECDVRPGGVWRYVMHGPDGTDHANESEFIELSPARVVIRHKAPVHAFTLTLSLAAQEEATLLTWHMRFDSATECARVREFVLVGNEQNLDRLAAVLIGSQPATEQLAIGGTS